MKVFSPTLITCFLSSAILLSAEEPIGLPEIYNPAIFSESSCSGFSFGIDYLLWSASQAGLSYATMINVHQTSNQTGILADGEDLFFNDHKWRSGGRASLAYQPPEASWDVRLDYTYYGNHIQTALNTQTLNSNGGGGGPSLGSVVIFTDFVPSPTGNNTFITSNIASWRLSLNQLDLEFEKEYLVSKDILFKPFFGVRGVEIKQNIQETIGGVSNLQVQSNPITISQLDILNKFTGIGIRLGTEASFLVGLGFDIYGSFACGLLWGKFDVEQSLNAQYVPAADYFQDTLIRKFHSESFNVDASFGIRWNTWINQKMLLSIRVGWENHLYRNMNQIQNMGLASIVNGDSLSLEPFTIDENIQRGDLTLQGLVFGASLSF